MTEMIIYENPLNETIRLCLRLEHLFRQIDYYMQRESTWDTRAALNAILEILGVIERPDLKNKLGQILNQYITAFSALAKSEDIDKKLLATTLTQLNKAMHEVHANQSKVGQELRSNEFLNAILQRLSTPAGTCAFSIPFYHLWLHQPANIRLKNLTLWLGPLEALRNIINLILKITRDSVQVENLIAKGGFYQASLDPNLAYQMIGIEIPVKEKLYPEISVGRYRLTIHFFELSTKKRACQTAEDVSFRLSYCRV